jgi:hypothetical protein
MSSGLCTIVTLWPGFGLGVVYLPIVHYHVLACVSRKTIELIGSD